MGWFFSWYLTVTLLGWLTFPLAYKLFPALTDRGYSLARTVGLLVWGYIFWLLTSLGLSQNDAGGLLLGLLVLAGLSFWALQSIERRQKGDDGQFGNLSILVAWVKHNRRLVLSVEGLFLVAFAFLAFARASNPELTSAEKPMELMFINAILRSPTFPPHDSWLSGYAISYYYFGYVMTAILARLTGAPGTVAHNLMTSLIFALTAIGAYGILYNLLALRHSSKDEEQADSTAGFHHNTRLPFLAPLFILFVSNLEGFLEVLHRRGLFWHFSADGSATSAFWNWLDILELNQPPSQPLGWVPDRYLWWWRASRVVRDYDLVGNAKEIIDEFPFFTFLHADLHPHVLATPFLLLGIAVALNLFLGGWRGYFNLLGMPLHINKPGFAFIALLLGGLAFLNTWDVLVALALVAGVYVLSRVRESALEVEAGWSWERFGEVVILVLPLGVLSVLLYLPFFISFSSQAEGVLPSVLYPTRGAQLWVMFAPLILPLAAFLGYVQLREKHPANWLPGLGLGFGYVLFLWVFMWTEVLLIQRFDPDTAAQFLASQSVANIGAVFNADSLRRLSYLGGLMTLLAIGIPALAILLSPRVPASKSGERGTQQGETVSKFVMLLIALGAVLVIAPDFIYLRDTFGYRINTVFKFYYQAWMLWGLAAAFGVALLFENLSGAWSIVFRAGLGFLLIMALTYPVFSLPERTNGLQLARAVDLLGTILKTKDAQEKTSAQQELSSLWTLDYFEVLQRQNPDEAAAIRWLDSAPQGVVAEAIGGSYSTYGRVSVYTGYPTVLGWPFHEYQWRGSFTPQGTREKDIETLYATSDWQAAQEIISRYNIRYIFVGGLERGKSLQEEKFQQHLQLAFRQGNVAIYEVP